MMRSIEDDTTNTPYYDDATQFSGNMRNKQTHRCPFQITNDDARLSMFIEIVVLHGFMCTAIYP